MRHGYGTYSQYVGYTCPSRPPAAKHLVNGRTPPPNTMNLHKVAPSPPWWLVSLRGQCGLPSGCQARGERDRAAGFWILGLHRRVSRIRLAGSLAGRRHGRRQVYRAAQARRAGDPDGGDGGEAAVRDKNPGGCAGLHQKWVFAPHPPPQNVLLPKWFALRPVFNPTIALLERPVRPCSTRGPAGP